MNLARIAALIGIAAVLTLGVISCAGSAQRAAAPPDIQGTWELAWPDLGPQLRQIKLITDTHFMWVTYDAEARVALASAGGPCVQDGGSYREQLDFAYGHAEGLAGTVQSFRVTVSGDTLFQAGELTSGGLLREVWLRAHAGTALGEQSEPLRLAPPKRPAPGSGNSR